MKIWIQIEVIFLETWEKLIFGGQEMPPKISNLFQHLFCNQKRGFWFFSLFLVKIIRQQQNTIKNKKKNVNIINLFSAASYITI
jgi:hypothetical protein